MSLGDRGLLSSGHLSGIGWFYCTRPLFSWRTGVRPGISAAAGKAYAQWDLGKQHATGACNVCHL